MEPDLVDLHSKSIDRVNALWRTSILINALTVGWVIAVYAGLMKSKDSTEISIYLRIALILLHFPAYCMSCINILREYRVLVALTDLLSSATKDIDGNKTAIISCLASNTITIKAPHIFRYVILIHVVYAAIIYSIICFPTLYLK